MTRDDVRSLAESFELAADRESASRMASYMRDQFPFFGITAPLRRTLSKPLVGATRSMEIVGVVGVVDDLRARHEREFHYVASDVLSANARRLTPAHLDDLRRWIVTDAWWDTVDAIASPTVGHVVLAHPEAASAMDDWIDADDLWLARTAIIHQLRFKDRTDAGRLFDYATRRSADDEFFIRKAIGWALRQYARTDPDAVRSFVERMHERLSPLTIREATKHLR